MQYKEQIMVDEIRRIMSEITGRDFSNINENISLFSSAIGTKARDILCLFLEIEKRYGVIIGAEKINNPNFFTLKSIAIEVENEKLFNLKQKFLKNRKQIKISYALIIIFILMRKGGNFMKIRKKMAGTIAMIMALSLGYNAGGPVVVHAHENAVITEKLGETAASQEGVIDFSAIKDNEDLEVADYLPSDINDMEKICTEDYSVNLVDMADNTEDNKTVNDNPNDAKAISLGTQVYDTVATELEQRWYAFSVAKATKFTAAMVMDDTADFDLYVYKLNETDGTLELVGGSAIVGAGTQELSMLKLDEGIYFIGIEAATGNGSF